MLINMSAMLESARAGKYAVGNYDATEPLVAEAILQAAERTQTPVILAIPGFVFNEPCFDYFLEPLAQRCRRSSAEVALHLDHASYEQILKSLKYGFTSIMIDASILPYDENVKVTRAVIKIAKQCALSVEAELGHVAFGEGSIEGDTSVSAAYTDPAEAAKFVQETGIDALAAAFGTVHGMQTASAGLDYALIRQLRDATGVPIVMHGGTGLDEESFKRAISSGVCKINVATDLFFTAVSSSREYLDEHEGSTAFHKMQGHIRHRVTQKVERYIEIFGTMQAKQGI